MDGQKGEGEVKRKVGNKGLRLSSTDEGKNKVFFPYL